VLPEDGASGFLGGIHFELVWSCRVRLPEDQVGGDDANKCVNSRGTLIGPDEFDAFLEEAGQWVGYLCKSWYKGALVAQDSQGGAELFEGGQFMWPLLDTFEFIQLDAELLAVDNYTEVFDSPLFEGALTRF